MCSDTFHPRYRSDVMRERLSGGYPEAPILLSVGRLGNEKNLKFLKVGFEVMCGAVQVFVWGDAPRPAPQRAARLDRPLAAPSPPPAPARVQGLLERTPGARLAFVGDGPAREELKQYFAGTPTVFMGACLCLCTGGVAPRPAYLCLDATCTGALMPARRRRRPRRRRRHDAR